MKPQKPPLKVSVCPSGRISAINQRSTRYERAMDRIDPSGESTEATENGEAGERAGPLTTAQQHKHPPDVLRLALKAHCVSIGVLVVTTR